jgi:hypothetical protein
MLDTDTHSFLLDKIFIYCIQAEEKGTQSYEQIKNEELIFCINCVVKASIPDHFKNIIQN